MLARAAETHGKTENQEIKNAQNNTERARRANAPACVLGKYAGGKTNQAFTVSTKSKSHAKNAFALWFLSAFAVELIVVIALAVLR